MEKRSIYRGLHHVSIPLYYANNPKLGAFLTLKNNHLRNGVS